MMRSIWDFIHGAADDLKVAEEIEREALKEGRALTAKELKQIEILEEAADKKLVEVDRRRGKK